VGLPESLLHMQREGTLVRKHFDRTVRKHLHRAALGLTTAALVGGTLATPAQAATGRAKAATDWLSGQLDAGLVTSEFNVGEGWQSYTDHGLTLDVYFAFDTLDVRAGKKARIIRAMEPEVDNYTVAFGTTYAGAVGKLLTAVRDQRIAPADYGDGSLLTTLEGLLVTSGTEEGRAKDSGAGADTSNAFGQSYVATALARSGSEWKNEAVRFLRRQQCDAGYFRELMTPDGSCDGGTGPASRPSVEATATAAMALMDAAPRLAAGPRKRAKSAAADAVRWLVTRQVGSGTFKGGRDTNATGLAATALGEAGKKKRAAEAASWVADLQVTRKLVRTTRFRARDLGAIAYDRTAFADGRSSGIARADRYQWRRATAQAAPALDHR
jgi:hypothetical protein